MLDSKPKRPKYGGRKKGSINKSTRQVKEAIEAAFEELGGIDSLVEWGRNKPDLFYGQVWPKLLPLQVNGNLNINQIIVEIDGHNNTATEAGEDN